MWRRPQLLGGGEVVYDFADRIAEARAFVRLDNDGKDRPFDRVRDDSSGATFAVPSNDGIIAAFTPHKDGKFGVTVAEYEVNS